ncbi:hypothetical protein ACLOJK_003269 [Asimina triloba]
MSIVSLKATVLDANLKIFTSETVHFDSELPRYKTRDGVCRDPSENGRISSPTLMWVEALDLLLQKLVKAQLDFGKITAISGSAQQHGSVYWKKGSSAVLASLDPKKLLVEQLADAFSIKESPIWMDCSTTVQCREIEDAVGGAFKLAQLTGSRAHERFTGPQIRKIFQKRPDVYHDTGRISLVSSFMASILIGDYANLDETDGSGMNLMDVKQRVWSRIALEATVPNLEENLGKLAPAYNVAGHIAPYFVQRYKPKIFVLKTWLSILQQKYETDDFNLLKMLSGLTLSSPGDLAISLGTSDTVFGVAVDPQPSLEGHVLPNPVDRRYYMVMLVYKNGSLTREYVRNQHAEKSWDVFNKFLQETPPLNVGFHRYVLDNFLSNSLDDWREYGVEEFDSCSEVRAIIEGQLLSMRAHMERSGLPGTPKRIIATGGASTNESILNAIASIFGCSVYTVQRPGLFSKYTSFMKKRMEIEDCLVQKLGRS